MTPAYIHLHASKRGDVTIPEHYRRALRRADPFIQHAVTAYTAMGAEKILSPKDPDRYGLVLGSCFGPMETNFDVLDLVITHQQTSPTLFSHSVFNAAAGYLSRIFNIKGPALTITDFSFPFFQALQQAMVLINSGKVDCCLVFQVETYSSLLKDTLRIHAGAITDDWTPGATALLLTNEVKGNQISRLEMNHKNDFSPDLVNDSGIATVNNVRHNLVDPLAASQIFSDSIKKNVDSEKYDFSMESAAGTVTISITI